MGQLTLANQHGSGESSTMRVTREFAVATSYQSPFQRVVPGVFTLAGQSVGRVYAVEGPDGLTLVDTGLACRSRNLLRVIERSGRRLRDVRRVLLTHVHGDHLGGLRKLQSNADLQVITLAENSAYLQGQILPAHDGDVFPELFGGLTVMATPGHLPGHASFWMPDRSVLFAGDTLSSFRALSVLPSSLQHDNAQLKRDVKRLADLSPSVICCGHGVPVTRDAAVTLRRVSDALNSD